MMQVHKQDGSSNIHSTGNNPPTTFGTQNIHSTGNNPPTTFGTQDVPYQRHIREQWKGTVEKNTVGR